MHTKGLQASEVWQCQTTPYQTGVAAQAGDSVQVWCLYEVLVQPIMSSQMRLAKLSKWESGCVI